MKLSYEIHDTCGSVALYTVAFVAIKIVPEFQSFYVFEFFEYTLYRNPKEPCCTAKIFGLQYKIWYILSEKIDNVNGSISYRFKRKSHQFY
ncbi:hypothetical protein [Holospora obtusa]|uniref:hypothetical protein n=1 Tax=Holospora obtusa TaxID=49893 RepID=UPI0012EB2AA6|nr:hypothetical protein [Holospora obtusa]